MTVTMVCIGIPVCRPLYKRWLDSYWATSIHSRPGNDRFRKHESFMATTHGAGGFDVSAGGPAGLVPLRTIGGSALSPMVGAPLNRCAATKGSTSSDDMETRKHGRLSRVYLATAGRVISRNGHDRANSSDEETLAGDYQGEHEEQLQHHHHHHHHHHHRHHEPRRPSNAENQVPRGLGLLMGITVTEEFEVTSNKDDL